MHLSVPEKNVRSAEFSVVTSLAMKGRKAESEVSATDLPETAVSPSVSSSSNPEDQGCTYIPSASCCVFLRASSVPRPKKSQGKG